MTLKSEVFSTTLRSLSRRRSRFYKMALTQRIVRGQKPTIQPSSIRLRSSTSSAKDISHPCSSSTFFTACITVVWSRPPNFRPISGKERDVSCFARYMATCRGRATERARRAGSHPPSPGDYRISVITWGRRVFLLPAVPALLEGRSVWMAAGPSVNGLVVRRRLNLLLFSYWMSVNGPPFRHPSRPAFKQNGPGGRAKRPPIPDD